MAEGVEILSLTASSQANLLKHQAVLFELETKKVAATIDVPTLPNQVRSGLRQLGLPVRLFGENLANVRDRLRLELAKLKVLQASESFNTREEEEQDHELTRAEEDENVTKYTRAAPGLITARQEFAKFSIDRATKRLSLERMLRLAAIERKREHSAISGGHDEVDSKVASKSVGLLKLEEMDRKCVKTFKALRQITLEGTQYGDSRALSCVCHQTVNHGMPLVATGCWTGSIHLWDGSSPAMTKLGEKTLCHQDRIMGIAMQPSDSDFALIATSSIDMTAKVFKATRNDYELKDGEDLTKNENLSWSIDEQSHLKGHVARLCRVAFHPMKRYVATTSFDRSWRLWDIETTQVVNGSQHEILLQDGHCDKSFGIGFHPDGSLCATTDFAGVIQLWDLRTGKSIRHFLGHARRVLNAEFHPINGFQLATAGDDGTIKIWDLRRRKQISSIPAHSNLVTGLKFDPNGGEYLASSSFDGTIKLWSCRDYKMLNQLYGHQGQVTGVDILDNNALVSSGFDKTLKFWR